MLGDCLVTLRQVDEFWESRSMEEGKSVIDRFSETVQAGVRRKSHGSSPGAIEKADSAGLFE